MKQRITAILTTIAITVSSIMLPCGNNISEWLFSLKKTHAYENIEAYPDFVMDCYVAGLYSLPTTPGGFDSTLYKSLNSYLEEIESPTRILYDALSQDSDFMSSVASWKALNLVFETGSEATDKIDEIGYYEAIILNALNVYMENSVNDESRGCI